MSVRVRFAPSPTGYPHIGNIRTVVFNWLYARNQQGRFVLRIEDTDQNRYVEDALREIMDGLQWLGLDWDEGPGAGGELGPYIQSQRLPLYKEIAETLIERGWAYRCNCSAERIEQIRAVQREQHASQIMYDRHCRELPPGVVSPDEPHVIRLKVPREGETVVHDLLKGDVVFENALIDDQVLLKTDGFPTYHLAVVIDDHLMQITHIIRADEWLPSTPKHVILYNALGWEIPTFVHVPLVLGPDGKKLSKRHGAVSISEFRKQGYLPEALFNFLALVGWSPGEGDEQEVFSREDLIARFSLERVNTAAAVFSYDKLDWMNGVYIRDLSTDELVARLIPFWQEAGMIATPAPAEVLPTLRKLAPLVQERLKTLRDVVTVTDFVFNDITPPSTAALIGKKLTVEQGLIILQRTHALLAGCVHFDAETLETSLRGLAEQLGIKAGAMFGLIRMATTGKEVSPPLFGTLEVLGRTETLKRLKRAEDTLSNATV